MINGLISLELKSGRLAFLKVFEKEKSTFGLFREAFLFGNEAWFIPARAENFVCINLDTYEMKYYQIPFSTRKDQDNMIPFVSSFVHDDYIYCVPRDIDTAVRINTKMHTIEKYDSVIDPNICFTIGGIVSDNKLRIFDRRHKEEIVIDLLTKTPTKTNNEMIKDSDYFICECGENIIKLDRKGIAIVYDKYFSENKTIELLYSQENYHGTVIGEKILLMPLRGSHFFTINPYTNEICKIGADICPEDVFTTHANKMSLIRSEKEIYITTEYTGYILEIINNRINRYYPLEWSSVFAKSLIDTYAECGRITELFDGKIINEDGKINTLRSFIQICAKYR